MKHLIEYVFYLMTERKPPPPGHRPASLTYYETFTKEIEHVVVRH